MSNISKLEEMTRAGKELCNKWKNDFMPVVYPGFSWYNLKHGNVPLNKIPREDGNLYMGLANAILKSSNTTMMYTSMFDEVNESTAIMPVVASKEDLPTNGTWLSLDVEGVKLPSDFYLKIAGRITEALKNGGKLNTDLSSLY